MQRRIFVAGGLALGAGCRAGAAQRMAWPDAMRRIEATLGRGGRLGLAVHDTGSGRRFGWRADERFAMASSFKLALAGWMLHQVDAGREALANRVQVEPSALLPHSPVTAQHLGPDGITVAELCRAAVAQSDNAAANLLLARHGGPAGFTVFVRGLGDGTTRLDRNEPTLNEGRAGDPRDTTTPQAMAALVETLALGSALSAPSRAQLVDWMRATQTGADRLPAAVPARWTIGHKTGTGRNGCTNDIGVLWPPAGGGGGAPVVIAVYLRQATVPLAAQEAAIAQAARAAVEAVRAS